MIGSVFMTEAEKQYHQAIKIPDLFPSKRVLCIQPHPDDNEVGAGAVIAKLADSGAEIAYLTVTNGDLGIEECTPEETAAIRGLELKEAGRSLGASHFYSLGLPDNFSEQPEEVALKIIEIIREFQPDCVFAPDPWMCYEAHSDHRKTGLAAAQAFLLSGNSHLPRGKKNLSFNAEKIAFYFTSHPNTVIDVSNHLPRQFEAIKLHKSQFDPAFLEVLQIYFTEQGRKLAADSDFELGMGLKVLSSFHLHCIVDAVKM